MAELNWTHEAERWLHDIYDYIARDNPEAAKRTVGSIYRRAQVLKEFPESGYSYHYSPTGEIRILLFGHYKIAYLIKTTENIDILGVFHGSLDIDRFIF